MDGVENGLLGLAQNLTSALALLLSCVVLIGYVYLDNAAYNKAAIYQEQAVAYMTALIANIKSTEGFSDDMEVVFVGFDNVSDDTVNEVASNEEMDGIQLDKYYNSLEEMLNKGVNLQFMRDHLGFGNENVTIDDGSMASLSEVKAMATYPNDGAIAVVEGKLVVKMGK